MGPDSVVVKDLEKQYGGLRPLRVRDLRVKAGDSVMLIGFDRPAAEVFVNLVTGAVLPDTGDVISLGRSTREIADSEEWLRFVEQFAIVSERVVLLDALTVSQNLAMSFGLELDPVPAPVRSRVSALAAEVGIDPGLLETRVADTTPLLRSRLHLARALALDPSVILFEHPSANLSVEEAKEYAAVVGTVSRARSVTMIGLLMDERFATATGGRLLYWQPATGELRQPPRFSLRRGNAYF
jgi:ABC-type transporter Mla maintaining outer membrane lipid asymmetry ATPase subunit MlaF